MKFLTDANIPGSAAKLLNAFDQRHVVCAHRDFWQQDTKDAVWISEVRDKLGDPKPVILGGDGRILRNPAELAALKKQDLTFMYLSPGWTNLRWEDFAWKIIKAWPDIVRNVSKALRSTIFEVKPGSLKVERIGTLAEWRTRSGR